MHFLFPLFLVASTTWALSNVQDEGTTDHPLQNAKVGDYVTYRHITNIGRVKSEMPIKLLVSAKDAKEVSLKLMLDAPALPNTKFDLTKPFDPTRLPIVAGNAELEKIAEGKETIKIGEKSYDCIWISYTRGSKRVESELRVWFHHSVPLTGIAKVEKKLINSEKKVQVLIHIEYSVSGAQE